jgi:hypothetical protein
VRFKCLYVATIICFLASSGFGQEQPCPEYSDKAALLQFLQDHRSNGVEADPECVDRAFAALSHDKSYTEALVQLLDFERNDKNDNSLRARSSRYPAIDALARSYAVSYLVRAIKENENEVIRMNAAEAIDLVYRTCVRTAISMLESKAKKPETVAEQQVRLRDAEKYISEHLGPRPCKGAPSER